jgi:hypothetical protein
MTNDITQCALRNGSVVKNVTLKSARRLHYCHHQFCQALPIQYRCKLHWQGDFGLVRKAEAGSGVCAMTWYNGLQRLSFLFWRDG